MNFNQIAFIRNYQCYLPDNRTHLEGESSVRCDPSGKVISNVIVRSPIDGSTKHSISSICPLTLIGCFGFESVSSFGKITGS